MQTEIIAQINMLFQQEVDRINSDHTKELEMINISHTKEQEQTNQKIQFLEEEIERNSNWKLEKKELLDKINQLEQYSNISLVRAYDSKLSKRNKDVEQLEKKNKYLCIKLEKLQKELRDYNREEHKVEQVLKQLSEQEKSEPEPEQEKSDPEPEQEKSDPEQEKSDPEQEKNESEPKQEKSESEPEDEIELQLVTLSNDSYFLDPETNELYEPLGQNQDELGKLLGKIKKITVRNKAYYQETIYNNLYSLNDHGEFSHVGKIADKKAYFNKI